ncbi:MAG TPA: hypothetical protein VJ901_14365 [Thermoanaerobaculia bacterium]|nr:hypothetical protein [Thermoanaerobaculia bacterium]
MTRVTQAAGWTLILLTSGGLGAVAGYILEDDVLAIAPAFAFLLLVVTAVISNRASFYTWVVALPLISMPLQPRAMYRRSLIQMWDFLAYFVAMVTCVAVGFALGAKLSIAVCIAIAWIAFAAATAIGLLAALFPPAVAILHFLWAVIGLLSFCFGYHAVVAFLGWRMSPLAGGASLLFATIIAIALVYVLLPHRYTSDAILQHSMRPPMRASVELSEPGDAVSRALRNRWSARRYALIRLSMAQSDPEAIVPRMRVAMVSLAAAMVIAWAVRLLFKSDLGFFAPALVIAVCVSTTTTTAELRGDRRHPLIETLPVDAREYASLRVVEGAIAIVLILMLGAIAMLASPWRIPLLAIAGAYVWLCSAVIVPMTQRIQYRVDRRRTRWSRFVTGCRRIGFICAIVLAVVFPPLLAFLWFRTWRIDARHDFDYEYRHG